MAENVPSTPGGPMPPKPGDSAKVQPKKETVRISLPPKPAATATIKLPTLPGAGTPPPSAPSVTPAPALRAPTPAPAAHPAGRPPTSTGAPAPPRPPTGGTALSRTGAAPAAPAVPAPPPRPAKAPAPAAAKTISGLDLGLAIAAALIGIAAVVWVLFTTVGPFALI